MWHWYPIFNESVKCAGQLSDFDFKSKCASKFPDIDFKICAGEFPIFEKNIKKCKSDSHLWTKRCGPDTQKYESDSSHILN